MKARITARLHKTGRTHGGELVLRSHGHAETNRYIAGRIGPGSGLGDLNDVTTDPSAFHWARKSNECVACESIYGVVGGTWKRAPQTQNGSLSIRPLGTFRTLP